MKMPPNPPQKKRKLPVNITPTPVKRHKVLPRDAAPLSPTKGSLRDKLWEVAWRARLKLYKYKKIGLDEVRVLYLKPSQDPAAEIIVEAHTMTLEELESTHEFAALSYHWGSGDALNPIFFETTAPAPHSTDGDGDMDFGKVSNIVMQVSRKRVYIKDNLSLLLNRCATRRKW
jgi:hypothetical protein